MHRKFVLVFLSLLLPLQAADTLKLPSRDPVVVLPLLKAFSPTGSYADITKILGKEDVDTGSALIDAQYKLIDGTFIVVSASPSGRVIYSINLFPTSSRTKPEVLYQHVETIRN